MISYFKYTDGQDFTLNGTPYAGVFSVIDGDAYTGAVYNSSSKKLSSTDTFLSECYYEKLNFNFSAGSPSLVQQIEQVSVYPRTILTIDTLTDIFNTLTRNNAKIFASGVRLDNNFLNQMYRSPSTLTYTNCITSFSNTNLQPVQLPLSRLPVSFTLQSNIDEFNAVFTPTNEKSSILLTDGLSGFKYFNNGGCSTGLCNSSSPVTFVNGYQINDEEEFGFTHKYLYFNRYSNTIYQTNNTTFSIFEVNYTSPNPRTFLKDSISISNTFNTPVSPYSSVYGRNFRSVLVGTGNDIILEIYRVSDAELITSLTRASLGFSVITNIAQRFEDDTIVILGTDANSNWYFAEFDIENLVNGDITPIVYTSITPLLTAPTIIEFVDFDSDIVIFKFYNNNGYLESVEYRSISSPITPMCKFLQPFDAGAAKNDIVSSLSADLSADDTVIGTFYNTFDSYFIDLTHRTDNRINTAIITDSSLAVDTKSVYAFLLPSDLKQNYVQRAHEIRNSSIGLTLNGALREIIQDILSVYYNFAQRYDFNRDLPTYIVANALQSFNLDNLVLYSNESINVATLNRVINSVLFIQQAIAAELDNRVLN